MAKKKKTNNDALQPQTVSEAEEMLDTQAVPEAEAAPDADFVQAAVTAQDSEAPLNTPAPPTKEKKNDTHFMKIFSILLAVILWCFVVLNENPNRSIWIRDVEIKITGENTLAARDLVVLEKEPLYIDVCLEGKQNVLSSIKAQDIRAQIDLSDVTEKGPVTIPAKIEIPGTAGVVITEQKNASGKLVIDEIIEKKLTIKSKITGETAMRDGYTLSSATTSPNEVIVKAPSTLLDNSIAVTESVDISNKTESGSTEVSISLLDAAGNVFTPISCEPKKATLQYTLAVTSLVKIEPTLENADKLNTRYDVYASATIPDSVLVRGDDLSMRQLNKLPTEPIDVLALYEGFEQGFLSGTEWNRASFVTTVSTRLALPEGISVAETEPVGEIEVSITYMNLSSKEDPYQIDSDGFPIAIEPKDATAEEAEEEPKS